MSLAWSQRAGNRVLILAPLVVAHQTVREGDRWGIAVTYARDQSEASATGITISNYERLEKFDPTAFDAVVLDESSILANFTGTTKKALYETPGRTWSCPSRPRVDTHPLGQKTLWEAS